MQRERLDPNDSETSGVQIMFAKLLIAFSFITIVGGCAPITEVRDLRSLRHDNLSSTKIEKVSYSSDLRCYVLDEKPLFNDIGQKIRTEAELKDRIASNVTSTWSTGYTALFWATMIYAVPVGLVTSAADGILGLPALPFGYRTLSRLKEESFKDYIDGEKALSAGDYSGARLNYLKAERTGIRMAQDSDVYYHLARAYEGEGNGEQARIYYQRFLDYSVSQYPEYFEKLDPARKSNKQNLRLEFDEAEIKLANGKNQL